MSALQRARDFYRRQRAITAAGVLAARTQVRRAPRDATALAGTIAGYQLASAITASRTLAAEAGRKPLVQAVALMGTNSAGMPLADPLQVLLDDIEAQLHGQLGSLTNQMLERLDRFVASEITNSGRDAASIEIVSEPMWTNYVRVLVLPSCSRCAVLAGRIYRDNEGFLRHPLCDCVHWPVESWEQAHDEGLVFSARDAFEKGQIRGLSLSDQQAIQDGADIAHVVNAAQGMATGSIFGRDRIKTTLAGTTKRSEWRKANPNRPVRLRPESIYDLAKDRDDEIRLLKLYGYIREDAELGRASSAGGGSGGRRPPAPPSHVPDPDDWSARKAALGMDFGRDPIRHAEIEFYERFKALGHDPEYIKLPPKAAPSNDFVWRNNDGIEVEVKSPGRPVPETIIRSIQSTVKQAARHPWAPKVKDHFIIDIGTNVLTPELRNALEQYNQRKVRDQIRRLWVMSENGRQLDEMHLA